MIKFKQFIDMLYPHQVFVLIGRYFKSKPLSMMENKEEVKDLVKGWGEEYVRYLHVRDGALHIELRKNNLRVLK